jgi:hypothetical protein
VRSPILGHLWRSVSGFRPHPVWKRHLELGEPARSPHPGALILPAQDVEDAKVGALAPRIPGSTSTTGGVAAAVTVGLSDVSDHASAVDAGPRSSVGVLNNGQSSEIRRRASSQ